MSKNGNKPKVTRKQIQTLLDGFEAQEVEAMAELEAADTALGNAKLADNERQRAEARARGDGVLPRAQIFFREETEEFKHLEYVRGRAVGKLADIVRRIKLLRKALSLTPK